MFPIRLFPLLLLVAWLLRSQAAQSLPRAEPVKAPSVTSVVTGEGEKRATEPQTSPRTLPSLWTLPGKGLLLDAEPAGGNLIISCVQPNRLVQLRLADRKVLRTQPTKAAYAWLIGNPVNHDIYATAWKRPEIAVFDSATLALKRKIALPPTAQPAEVVVTRQGTTAFIGDIVSPEVYVVDLVSGKTVKQIELGDAGPKLLLAEDFQRLYVGLNGGIPEGEDVDAAGKPKPYALAKYTFVEVVDLTTLKRTERIVCPGGLVADLALSVNNRTLYVLSEFGNVLSAVEIGKSHRLKKSPKPLALSDPTATRFGISLAFDALHNQLLVCHEDEKSEDQVVLKRINAHSFAMEETLPGGGQRIIAMPSPEASEGEYLILNHKGSAIHHWKMPSAQVP